MQISKFHKFLRYIRRPVCFVVAISVLFVWFFCYGASAAPSGYTDFETHYNVSSDVDLPTLNTATMMQLYSNDGYNSNNITGNNAYIVNSITEQAFNSNIVHNANYLFYDVININGVDYNFSDGHMLIGDNLNHANYSNQRYIFTEGNVAIVNHWIVSDAPILIGYREFNNGSFGNFQQTYNIDTVSVNGFYCWDINTYNGYGARFYDLDLFLSSSDGDSGFTNFSLDSTDFSFDSDNYNFNYLKTGNYIAVPSDPEPEPEPDIAEVKGQYYNYAYVDGYIRPTSETDIGVNLTFSFNDYMRLHPNEYEIRFQWYATLTGNNLPSAYGSNYFESINSLPLSTITGYNGWNQGGDNSRFKYSTTVNSLKNSNDKSLKDAFEEIYVLGGGSYQTYTGFSIIDFLTEYYTGYSNETVGKWVVRGNFTNILTKITLGCKISIVWVGGEPEQIGGKLWITYDTENGSNIVSNDIGVNYNPPSEPDPSYPSEIKDSNGNIIVQSGGSNITVNPATYANFNAVIEYLFNLDATDLNNIAGNTHNAIQHVITTLGDTSENGFWGVLERTYSMIPNDIWNWIKVAVGAICGGAIIGWVFRVGRVKNN